GAHLAVALRRRELDEAGLDARIVGLHHLPEREVGAQLREQAGRREPARHGVLPCRIEEASPADPAVHVLVEELQHLGMEIARFLALHRMLRGKDGTSAFAGVGPKKIPQSRKGHQDAQYFRRRPRESGKYGQSTSPTLNSPLPAPSIPSPCRFTSPIPSTPVPTRHAPDFARRSRSGWASW